MSFLASMNSVSAAVRLVSPLCACAPRGATKAPNARTAHHPLLSFMEALPPRSRETPVKSYFPNIATKHQRHILVKRLETTTRACFEGRRRYRRLQFLAPRRDQSNSLVYKMRANHRWIGSALEMAVTALIILSSADAGAQTYCIPNAL